MLKVEYKNHSAIHVVYTNSRRIGLHIPYSLKKKRSGHVCDICAAVTIKIVSNLKFETLSLNRFTLKFMSDARHVACFPHTFSQSAVC